ncbi:monooxygenase [Penicillium cosmopolitanum]|uniref:Monooxygenase n=1 Tax=Penicillium cosmopolitanum TaxID=1131564 RepID=A0A9X0B7M8_9EURO|nr:monooxygenase [Penicillium cosmopolitanum]KAJ5391159.1 monooxygenase [Penicillium cosmopolitanum]
MESQANQADWETTDVLICGCGPTGAMLSGYLGKLGINNILLEKEAAITTDPRGIALDDDGIRLLQGLGLYEHVFTEIGSYIAKAKFISGTHQNLHAKHFLHFDMASSEGQTGHVGILAHKQPILEKHLRSTIEEADSCELRSSCTLTSISEDENWVYATYDDPLGRERRIRAKFLAAADGKTGFTRKMYLEPKGIRLEWAEQTKYEETWVALNWKLHLPTKETHPSFPLWNLGYTPEQVYDLFFPVDFRFLCNPDRPAVCGRFGLSEDRLWRFEFVIAADEDGVEMASEKKVRDVVYPYLTHSGSRYGLKQDVSYPEDCIEVLRSRPFRFSARSCNKWSLNRVILCGDAAHVFPPFGGQGITSGFRDAISLAWRLAIACKPGSNLDYEHLLTGWYLERKQQLDASLASTVRNGDMVNGKNWSHIFFAIGVFGFCNWFQIGSTGLNVGPEEPDLPGTRIRPRCPFYRNLVVTYCMSLRDGSEVQFTDDVIFFGKKGIFQIVVLLNTLDEVESAIQDMEEVKAAEDLISPAEATFFVPRVACESAPAGRLDAVVARPLFRTASSDEFAHSTLCNSRPEPRGYSESLIWDTIEVKRYVVLRLDRFVFATCNSKTELERVLRQLSTLF